MSDLNALEGFDVSAAVERMLGDTDLWWQALALFVAHFQAWEAGWLAAQGQDALERKAVHALRSGAANVGAVALAKVAGELEGRLLRRCAGEEVAIPGELRSRLQEQFRLTLAVAGQATKTCRAGRA